MKKYHFFLLLFVFAALHLILATRFELGVDEAHYVLYGLRPDWSYFDHPPLVGWVQLLFAHWPMELLIKSRLPAILASALSSWMIVLWLKEKKYSSFEIFWAVVGLNFSVLYLSLSLFFLPDTLLIVLTPALALSVAKLEKQKTWKNWLLLGLVLGLSGLSKYTAGLFLAPLVIYWIHRRWLQDFTDIKALAAVALSLIMISPILYWNSKNGGVSFKYQSGHILSLSNWDWKVGLGAELSQWLGWGFFIPWVLLLFRKDFFQFEKLLILTIWGFFGIFAFFGNFLPHWIAPAFVIAIPLAIAESLRQKQYFTKSLRAAFVAAGILFLFLHLELGFHLLPKSASQGLYRDIQGWRDFSKRISDQAETHRLEIAVTNWTFASRISLYTKIEKPIFVLDERFDQFDLWNPKTSQGQDLLILVEKKQAENFWANVSCKEKSLLSEDGPQFQNETLVPFEIWKCLEFQITGRL